MIYRASQARVEQNFAEFMCTTITPCARTPNPNLPNNAPEDDVIADTALETINLTPSLPSTIEGHDPQLFHVDTIFNPINGGSYPDHIMRQKGMAKQPSTGASIYSIGKIVSYQTLH